MIVGIVAGVVAVVAALIVIFLLHRRSSTSNSGLEALQEPCYQEEVFTDLQEPTSFMNAMAVEGDPSNPETLGEGCE
jgi:hypothetical protein